MAEKKVLACYKNILSDINVKLRNIELHNVTTYDVDEQILIIPKCIGFYRQPNPDEYPIDLAKGYKDMIFSISDPVHYLKQKTLHYIMSQNQRPKFDICTTRGALKQINFGRNTKIAAIHFKDCIYIKSLNDALNPSPRESYQYELRKNLFVDTPGDLPDVKKRLDQRKQIYVNFSAHLGIFKILYSAEIAGVDNTEPLGDLKDPGVLKQLRFTMAKVRQMKNNDYSREKIVEPEWLFQAHFAGIEQLRLAYFNEKALVTQPIETIQVSDLYKKHESKLNKRLQLLHSFLCKIKNLMADDDCPYTTYVFSVRSNCISYERHVGQNKYGFLDEEYIKFVNDKYKD
ncbi:uncharacterized protein LOC115562370 [Drosophila navojoa]|uniref:uncharacterized protein LOC115562370 n=1 Tax=Drosophila navojoa TaxID=7232 RepID=UPI0011BE9DE1|nr:uncharacterized protein LOC115562370 [Drosophila navojoa]